VVFAVLASGAAPDGLCLHRTDRTKGDRAHVSRCSLILRFWHDPDTTRPASSCRAWAESATHQATRPNINTFLIPIGSSKRRLAGLIPHLKYIHIVKYPLKYIHIVKYPGVAMVSNTTIIELKRMHIQYHYNIIAFFFFSMARQIEAMGEIVSEWQPDNF
jgi:hypothetical protein